jgi:CheY-like chemotaxis protein
MSVGASPEALRDELLSHELRSPLNAIKSWAHVLENHLDGADPTVRRALAGILTGVEQQVRVIEDLLEATPRSETTPAGSDAGAPLPSLSGIRVILIDDQREARESLTGLLMQVGAEVVAATSGYEALAHLALSDSVDKPEVIVCDIAMPGQDGYATLKRIRAWEAARPTSARGRRRPAIAVSAFAQRDCLEVLDEGFEMLLTKPVVPAELIGLIASVASD